MCLSIPAKIVSIDGNIGQVSTGGAFFKVGLHLIENPEIGEYILLHAGFAIQKISEKEAEETLALLKELEELSDE
jgi:hydrogenase expression/formation protein HypC